MPVPIQPRVLKGFRDYLPAQMIPRARMIARIREVFESFGFLPLETPTLEYAEILLGKYGQDAEKLLYRFTDHGERDVCMRYDLTVPLARVVAQYGDLPMPFKRYQISPVWRGENTGKGRYREFYQCDVDIVGSGSLLSDCECVWVDYLVMTSLGLSNFEIHLSNRKLLDGLAQWLGDLETKRLPEVYRTIDKLPTAGPDAVKQMLAGLGLSDAQVAKVFQFLDLKGTPEEVLGKLAPWFAEIPAGATGIQEMRTLLTLIDGAGIPRSHIHLDLSIARGLDYYTGTVFETFLTDLPHLGSVMSGGRYDGLIGFFAGRDLPAVGISVGLDRLFSGLEELGKVDRALSTAQMLMTQMDAALLPLYLKTAGELRHHGLRVEMYHQADKLGKQLQYADKRGIPLAVIIGSDEAARGVAQVKLLAEKRQDEVPLSSLAAWLVDQIKGSSASASPAPGRAR
ncbi:MAG TPA: histidine--tRNA ligase [Candidatus Xenobia bacterium]|jgi:histidyl-tRNA synthetase